MSKQVKIKNPSTGVEKEIPQEQWDQMKKDKTTYGFVESSELPKEVIQKEGEINPEISQIKAKSKELAQKETDLNSKEEALNAKAEELAKKEADLNSKEEALNAKTSDAEKPKVADSKSDEQKTAAPKAKTASNEKKTNIKVDKNG